MSKEALNIKYMLACLRLVSQRDPSMWSVGAVVESFAALPNTFVSFEEWCDNMGLSGAEEKKGPTEDEMAEANERAIAALAKEPNVEIRRG